MERLRGWAGALKVPLSSRGSGPGRVRTHTLLTSVCPQLRSEYVERSSSCDRPEPPGSVHTDTRSGSAAVKVSLTCRCCSVFPCGSDSVLPPSDTFSHVPLCFRSADAEEWSNIPSEQIWTRLSSQFRFSCCATSSYWVLLHWAAARTQNQENSLWSGTTNGPEGRRSNDVIMSDCKQPDVTFHQVCRPQDKMTTFKTRLPWVEVRTRLPDLLTHFPPGSSLFVLSEDP